MYFIFIRKVNYWIQFVENHSIPGTSLPHVIVIGSHFDLLSKVNASVVNQVEEYTKARLHLSLLAFDGFFSIDCRYVRLQKVVFGQSICTL